MEEERNQWFGQIVIGPPGSGKTTYCQALSLYFKAVQWNIVLVNLDPANETAECQWDIDISELITVDDIMEEFKLGPNGALIYAMEFLEKNIDWLISKIEEWKCKATLKEGSVNIAPYFIFDLPGQVELYINHTSLNSII